MPSRRVHAKLRAAGCPPTTSAALEFAPFPTLTRTAEVDATLVVRRSRSPLFALVAVVASCALRAEQNWPRFGGPEGSGRSAETSLPVSWDARSVVWKTA